MSRQLTGQHGVGAGAPGTVQCGLVRPVVVGCHAALCVHCRQQQVPGSTQSELKAVDHRLLQHASGQGGLER